MIKGFKVTAAQANVAQRFTVANTPCCWANVQPIMDADGSVVNVGSVWIGGPNVAMGGPGQKIDSGNMGVIWPKGAVTGVPPYYLNEFYFIAGTVGDGVQGICLLAFPYPPSPLPTPIQVTGYGSYFDVAYQTVAAQAYLASASATAAPEVNGAASYFGVA